jgi:hypothetical protein
VGGQKKRDKKRNNNVTNPDAIDNNTRIMSQVRPPP